MRPSLVPGLAHSLDFVVPRNKTVPFLYPEAPEFASMPETSMRSPPRPKARLQTQSLGRHARP